MKCAHDPFPRGGIVADCVYWSMVTDAGAPCPFVAVAEMIIAVDSKTFVPGFGYVLHLLPHKRWRNNLIFLFKGCLFPFSYPNSTTVTPLHPPCTWWLYLNAVTLSRLAVLQVPRPPFSPSPGLPWRCEYTPIFLGLGDEGKTYEPGWVVCSRFCFQKRRSYVSSKNLYMSLPPKESNKLIEHECWGLVSSNV